MKAVSVFPASHEVRVTDEPEPRIEAPDQVKMRMLEVGICGTDKEIVRFEYGEPPPGTDHLILGHESLGEVVEAGPDSGMKAGELAVLMVRRPCPHAQCRACRAGRQDFCYTGDFTERGIKQQGGFMAEFVVEQGRYVVPVPRELRDIAVLAEPLTIAEKAFIQVMDIQERLPWVAPAAGSEPPLEGRRGLVLGAGAVGLLGTMKLVAAGCETTLYSREPAGGIKSCLARDLGARYISAADTPVSALPGMIGPVDIVYEATGAAKVAFDSLQVLGANAIFVFTGIPGRKHPVELDTATLMRRMVLNNQVILGSVNAGHAAFQAAVRDLALFRERFAQSVDSLIVERHPFEHFPKLDLENLSGAKHVVSMLS